MSCEKEAVGCDRLDKLWQSFLDLLKVEIGSQIVTTWFRSVKLISVDKSKSTIVVGFPNDFVHLWIKRNYYNLFKLFFPRVLTGWDFFKFEFEVCKAKVAKKTEGSSVLGLGDNKGKVLDSSRVQSSDLFLKKKEFQKTKSSRGSLNEKYIFDNFIVGSNNHLAYSAGYSISQGLGKSYNPLFIYGSTGLGKTHLLHCIGNEFRLKYANAKVIYKSSDSFVNEFIKSVRSDKIQIFREKYFKADLLLIDDVQFLSQKEQTQEIFFNIFNKMHDQKKNIVLSSDTSPDKIVGLQDRLRSRFGWGLVADISAPSVETKIAILGQKAEGLGVVLEKNVAEFIAKFSNASIRELEGLLIKLVATTMVSGKPITIELAKKVFLKQQAVVKNIDSKKFEPDNIIVQVSRSFGLSPEDIKSRKRSYEVAEARQIGAYLIKKHTQYSLKHIGGVIGGRNHSTVLHSINLIESRIKEDKSFASELKNLENNILASQLAG